MGELGRHRSWFVRCSWRRSCEARSWRREFIDFIEKDRPEKSFGGILGILFVNLSREGEVWWWFWEEDFVAVQRHHVRERCVE